MSEREEWEAIAKIARVTVETGSKKAMIRGLLRILLAAEANVRAIDAAPEQAPTGEDASSGLQVLRVVRHKKRGTCYTVLGVAELQASGAYLHMAEGRRMVVYSDVDTEKLWVRELKEFEDGRFEDVI